MNTSKCVIMSIAIIFIFPATGTAGSLDSPAPPSDAGSAMYTLEDLYNRLATGEEGAKRTGGFTEPVNSPGVTGRTIDEIMSMMPAKDANAAGPGDVIEDKTFWRLDDSWGVQTGTLSSDYYDPEADDSGAVSEDIPLAGNLEPPAAPSDAGSAMYTLEDLYKRLATGAEGAKRAGEFAEPAASPAGTGHTIDEIMSLMPALDDSNAASPSYVLQGKTFWGLKDGAWGIQTGTLPLTCYGLASDDPDVCGGKGTCDGLDDCSCDYSYYGDECTDWNCYSYHRADSEHVCGGHGTCTAPDYCVCDEGYLNDYSLNPYDPPSSWCSDEGDYIGPSEYTDNCDCEENIDEEFVPYCSGITGEPGEGDCSAWFCGEYANNESGVCGGGNGECVGDNNCECYDGYYGFYCEDYMCFDVSYTNPDVCSGNGICMGPDQCQCFGNYTGDECDVEN